MTAPVPGDTLPANEITRTDRDVKTDVKKAVRDVDGTDLKDRVANAADEARIDLETAVDGACTAASEP